MFNNRSRHMFSPENMPDSVACFRIIVDDEGNPLDYIIGEVNQAFAKMLGKNKKDIEGKGVLEILPGAPDIKLDWVGAFNEGVLEGKQVRFQYYLLPLKRWFEVTGYKEGPGFFITIFRDIDHLKRVAENLEKEKGLLEEMVNGVSDVLALQYPDFTIGFYNQAGYELLGMTPEEVKGKKCYELLGRDRQCQKCATRKALETGKREQMEIYIPEKDIYLDCSSTPLLDREGRVIRIIEQLRDITPEKKQEMKLKEMEERLSLLVMETPSIVYSFKIVEGQPEITYVSGNIEKILGYTPEELINKGIDYWISRLHPEDLKKLNFKFEGDFRSGEYRFKDREGNYRWISDQQRNVEFKNESLVVGTWWDITEWKEMEIALREREEKYRAIFHQSVAGVYLHDLEGRILEVNEEACSQTGYSKEKLSKLTVFDLHPDRGNTINLPREEILRLWNQWQPGEKYQLEGEHQGKDGRIIDIEISTGPVCLGDKKYILALVQDITRRKEIERALQESETKFRELFNNAGDSIYIHDMAGNFLEVNQVACEKMGYSREELLGMNLEDIVSPCHYNLVPQRVRHIKEYGYGIFETAHLEKGGREIPMEVNTRLIHYDGEEAVIGIVRDITERKLYEEQLKYLSLHDQLTGLYNRFFFEEEVQRLNNSRGHPITIISADLDGLKLINDTVGHEKGDEMLKVCAGFLKKVVRGSDILARVGGDEFAIILPQTDRRTAKEIIERINSQVEKYNREHPNQLHLSISLGMATAPDSREPLEKTFKKADDMMYRDKLHRGSGAKSQIIKSLMIALEERDYITEGHVRRLGKMCLQVGEKLSLSQKQLSDLVLLSHMHDLGKVGIPDSILFKEAPLTEEEWTTMRQHSEKGYRIALSSPDLVDIADLILKHHEWWDGRGYPLGLKGEEIPIECRILAIVDAFDAMTSDRPYQKAVTRKEAVEELKRCAGTQFDPTLVKVFLSVLEE